jgi:hypothetical protein
MTWTDFLNSALGDRNFRLLVDGARRLFRSKEIQQRLIQEPFQRCEVNSGRRQGLRLEASLTFLTESDILQDFGIVLPCGTPSEITSKGGKKKKSQQPQIRLPGMVTLQDESGRDVSGILVRDGYRKAILYNEQGIGQRNEVLGSLENLHQSQGTDTFACIAAADVQRRLKELKPECRSELLTLKELSGKLEDIVKQRRDKELDLLAAAADKEAQMDEIDDDSASDDGEAANSSTSGGAAPVVDLLSASVGALGKSAPKKKLENKKTTNKAGRASKASADTIKEEEQEPLDADASSVAGSRPDGHDKDQAGDVEPWLADLIRTNPKSADYKSLRNLRPTAILTEEVKGQVLVGVGSFATLNVDATVLVYFL